MRFRQCAALCGLLVVAVCSGCGDKCTPYGGEATGVTNGTCAPKGEAFTDHYACEGIEGPCPSGDESGASAKVPADAARQADPDVGWSAEQIRACSCSCCHHDGGLAAHIFSWDFEPAWTDSLGTETLRHLVDGDNPDDDIAPGDNNGFTRTSVDIPTTDGNRFKTFLERELSRR